MLVTGCLLLISAVSTAWGRSPATPTVEVKDSLVTLQVAENSLKGLLQEIGRQAGIAVTFLADDEPVSAEVAQMPLALALQKLTRNYSRSLVYEGAGDERINRLFVLARTGRANSVLIWSGAPAAKGPGHGQEPVVEQLPLPPELEDTMRSMAALDPLVRFDLPAAEAQAASHLAAEAEEMAMLRAALMAAEP